MMGVVIGLWGGNAEGMKDNSGFDAHGKDMSVGSEETSGKGQIFNAAIESAGEWLAVNASAGNPPSANSRTMTHKNVLASYVVGV